MSTMSGDQSTASSFITMFVVVAAVLLVALLLLGGGLGEAQRVQVQVQAQAVRQSPAPAIEWLRPDQVHVPSGLAISAHAAKHSGDTEKIYRMLLQGKCAEVAKFCGGSESEFAYFCVDPITGIVGAVLQFGDEITTGFYERDGSGYWTKRVPKERWKTCQ